MRFEEINICQKCKQEIFTISIDVYTRNQRDRKSSVYESWKYFILRQIDQNIDN